VSRELKDLGHLLLGAEYVRIGLRKKVQLTGGICNAFDEVVCVIAQLV